MSEVNQPENPPKAPPPIISVPEEPKRNGCLIAFLIFLGVLLLVAGLCARLIHF
jgi:hypothetical protein